MTTLVLAHTALRGYSSGEYGASRLVGVHDEGSDGPRRRWKLALGGAPAQQVWAMRPARGYELTVLITKLLNSATRAEGRNKLRDVAILSRVQDDVRRALGQCPRGPPHSLGGEEKPETTYTGVGASTWRVRRLGIRGTFHASGPWLHTS